MRPQCVPAPHAEEHMPYPLMFRLGQRLPGPKIDNVPAAVEAELSKLGLQSSIRPGDTVAITCGARRIANFVDILLVDEIGTGFGCLGADSNVTGRKFNAHAAAEGEFPQIQTIVYRNSHPHSYGNAIGMGHAEFVRSRILRKTDKKVTRLNALTAGMPTLAASPIDYETDREILDAALMLTLVPEKARIVWIRNTSSVIEFECSEPYLEEVQHWKDLSVLSTLHPFDFDADGNLRDFVAD
jgi:hypothetical protein